MVKYMYILYISASWECRNIRCVEYSGCAGGLAARLPDGPKFEILVEVKLRFELRNEFEFLTFEFLGRKSVRVFGTPDEPIQALSAWTARWRHEEAECQSSSTNQS